jgi:3-oxoacyl-[acyl-carrier protein] reductase
MTRRTATTAHERADAPPNRTTEPVAIITGAAKGIGAAIARRLNDEGYRLALMDADAGGVQTVASEVVCRGGSGLAIDADVSEPEQVEAAILVPLREWGRIDVLVNCAGIAGEAAPIEDQTLTAWERMISVNLSSVFYFCRAVIPVMKRQKFGRIVNIASISGKEGNPNMVPYSSSKAGVIGLTKALAKEVAQEGILVHSVAPAVIRTGLLDQLTAEQVAYMEERIPMGRAGTPEEVAALVAWLISSDCSFSTGFCYDVSGGRATY